MTDARKALESALTKRIDWHKCSCPEPCDDYGVFPGGCAGRYRQDYQDLLALAAIDAALASGEQGSTAKPDYCYNPNDWECTHHWSDRFQMFEDRHANEPMTPERVATLAAMPDKWAIAIPTEWHEGEPDDWEIQWFDSEADAAAARAAAAPPAPETRT